MVFALGEIEALVAAFTRLLLFVLFPGTLLENIPKRKHRIHVSRSSVCSVSTRLKECLTARLASFFVCLAACLPFLLSINKDTDRLTLKEIHYPSLKDNGGQMEVSTTAQAVGLLL